MKNSLFPMSLATCASSSSEWTVTTAENPAEVSFCAIAEPIPEVRPVTSVNSELLIL